MNYISKLGNLGTLHLQEGILGRWLNCRDGRAVADRTNVNNVEYLQIFNILRARSETERHSKTAEVCFIYWHDCP
jgi:hypothetical protein